MNADGCGSYARKRGKMQVPCFDKRIVTNATVSIGVASARLVETEMLSEFIERADRMLYQAKGDGRNRIRHEQTDSGLRKSVTYEGCEAVQLQKFDTK